MNTKRDIQSCIPHLAILLLSLLLIQGARFRGFPGGGSGYLDFDHAYYPAAKSIRTNPGDLYQGVAFDEAQGKLHTVAPAYFVNLPLLAWLFVPFTLFPLKLAGNILLILNVLCSLICLLLVQQRIVDRSNRTRWIVTLAFATSGPLMNALNLGQTTVLILLFLLLSERMLYGRKEIFSGLWLAAAAIVKVPLLLLIPVTAFRRSRVFVAAVLFLLVLTVLSILLYGWQLHEDYFNIAFRANSVGSIAAHNSQSAEAFVARIFSRNSLWSWQPVKLSPLGQAIVWFIRAIVLFFCLRSLRPRPSSHRVLLLQISATLAASLVILPIYWAHYGVWLLPVAAVLAVTMEEFAVSSRIWGILIFALMLVNFPVPPQNIIVNYEQHLWFRLAISHELLGTLLLFAQCVWCLKRSSQTPAFLSHGNQTAGQV